MKRFLCVVLAAILSLALVGCGGSTAVETRTSEQIMEDVEADFDSTATSINSSYDDAAAKLGDSYETYSENKQALLDWYASAEQANEALGDRTVENMRAYYRATVGAKDRPENAELIDTLSEAYKTLTNSYESYYKSVVTDGPYVKAYETYIGVISDAYGASSSYGELYTASSDFVEAYTNSTTAFYGDMYDTESEIYADLSAIIAGIYKGNYNVDELLADVGKATETAEAATTEAADTAATGAAGATATASAAEPEAEASSDAASSDANEVSAGLKETLDGYESFMNEYVDFMLAYKDAEGTDNALNMAADYTRLLANYTEWADRYDAIDESSLGSADLAYYLEVQARVLDRLAELQ